MSARVATLKEAIAQLDREIAAEEVRKAEAERAARRDEATTIVEAWRKELVGLKTRLSVVGTAADLAGLQDRSGHGTTLDLISPRMHGHEEAVTELIKDTLAGFDNQLRILRLADSAADELATKVLKVNAEFDAKVRRAA